MSETKEIVITNTAQGLKFECVGAANLSLPAHLDTAAEIVRHLRKQNPGFVVEFV